MNPLDNKKVMELTGGLKNALERGETLEEAIQSLKNAGYNEGVVIEASKKLKITLEGDEEKKEIPQKKQKNNFFGLRKLFSRKPKTENQKPIPQKNNNHIISQKKINTKIIPVKITTKKQKNNFFGLRELLSRKQKTTFKKIDPAIKIQKILKVKNPIKKPGSKRLIWITIVILSILILIGSAILGLYWDRWVG